MCYQPQHVLLGLNCSTTALLLPGNDWYVSKVNTVSVIIAWQWLVYSENFTVILIITWQWLVCEKSQHIQSYYYVADQRKEFYNLPSTKVCPYCTFRSRNISIITMEKLWDPICKHKAHMKGDQVKAIWYLSNTYVQAFSLVQIVTEGCLQWSNTK